MITTVKAADGFDHHPKCFQVRPEGPMPEFPDACDCKTLWMLEYAALRERVRSEPAPMEQIWRSTVEAAEPHDVGCLVTAREPSAVEVSSNEDSQRLSSNEDKSAVEVIAEATYRSLLGSWTYDSPVERAVAMWDPRPAAAEVLAALKAAGFVVVLASVPEPSDSEPARCGAWGGCPLPKGHNMGRADIPEHHQPGLGQARYECPTCRREVALLSYNGETGWEHEDDDTVMCGTARWSDSPTAAMLHAAVRIDHHDSEPAPDADREAGERVVGVDEARQIARAFRDPDYVARLLADTSDLVEVDNPLRREVRPRRGTDEGGVS